MTKVVRNTTVSHAELDDRASSQLAQGALGALRGVAGVGGGLVSQGLVGGVDGAVGEAQQELQVDRSVTLEVAAGERFEVVITDLE